MAMRRRNGNPVRFSAAALGRAQRLKLRILCQHTGHLVEGHGTEGRVAEVGDDHVLVENAPEFRFPQVAQVVLWIADLEAMGEGLLCMPHKNQRFNSPTHLSKPAIYGLPDE